MNQFELINGNESNVFCCTKLKIKIYLKYILYLQQNNCFFSVMDIYLKSCSLKKAMLARNLTEQPSNHLETTQNAIATT